jgi:2'-5' RNA ligase
MTVVFLGDIMKGMKKTDREALYIAVNAFDLGDTAGIMAFDSFEFFGKHRNLLIAKFKAPQYVIDHIITYKKQFVKFGAVEEDFFLPHITLGKLSSNASLPNEMSDGCEGSLLRTLQGLTIPQIPASEVHLV